MTDRTRLGLLLAVTILVYGNTLLNSFTADDELYIFHNPQVTAPSLQRLFHPNKVSDVFRPVTFATLALNWAAGGAGPFGYHLFNQLLHAGVTMLLYLLFRKLLASETQGSIIALVAGLLFAVHPIHTEAVASIVGRAELLASGFLLAAWLFHLQDRQIPALLCFLLALLSKESAAVFLPLAITGDYVRGKFKPLRRYGWIASLTMLYLALLWKIQGGRFGQAGISFLDNPLASLPARLRILNALRVAWKYAALHVYPATLSCDYSYNAITLYANWKHTALALVAGVLVLVVWIWALWSRRNGWALAGAIYLGGFAVTANLLTATGTIMGERLAYLPSAGFCLLAALVWIQLENRNRALAWVLFSILFAALGLRTVVRNRDWQDNFSLYSAAVRAVPGSAKMHANLGNEYMRRGQLDAAHTEYETALHTYPDFPEAMESYGLLEARLEHDQTALRLLERALSMAPRSNIYYDQMAVNLAEELMKLGRNNDALKLLDREIAASPEYSPAWSDRAILRYQHGDLEAARTDAQTAVRLDPANREAQNLMNLLSAPRPTAAPR
jgi:tetratricopeptide (TPR) repeat protein